MRSLQAQAQALQAQPKQNRDEALRLLELSVRERLGTTARLLVAGDRVTVTLSGHRTAGAGPVAHAGAGQCTRLAQRGPPFPQFGRPLGRHPGADPAIALIGAPTSRGTPDAHLPGLEPLGAGPLPAPCPGCCCAVLLFAPARWLTGAIERASDGRILLSEPRGTVWNGSAQLLLAGGAGSTDAVALPSRLDWRLRPRWDGLVGRNWARACCTTQPLALRVRPRWGGAQVTLADGRSQWPAALLAGLGTPWNTLQFDGDLLLDTRGLSVEWVQGRLAIAGRAELTAQRLSSRLSTLRPMGSYRITVLGGEHADPAAGDAARKPAAERQRPMGGLAPALLGRPPAPRPSAKAPCRTC